MRNLFFLLIIPLFFSNCAANLMDLNKRDLDVLYQPDLDLQVGERKGEGTLVVPENPDGYQVKFTAPGEINILLAKSCHRRNRYTETATRLWILKKNKLKNEVTYKFLPAARLEREGCPLYFNVVENNKRQYFSHGIMVITSPKSNVKDAVLYCNASVFKGNSGSNQYNGTAICASQVGLKQEIEFSEPMQFIQNPREECRILSDEGYNSMGTLFEYKTPLDLCAHIAFNHNGLLYVLYTYGYQESIDFTDDLREEGNNNKRGVSRFLRSRR